MSLRSQFARLLFGLVFFFSASASLADDKIKIGVQSTLTGDAATYGTDIKNAAVFANEKLGGGRFELVIEDDKCNGKDSLTAAKKLVEVDKVRGVVGFGCSGALLAAAPIFEKAKIPTIGTETSAAAISEAGHYIFRTQPSDAAGVKLLYGYLIEKHKIFGMLSAETDFAQGIVSGLTALARDGRLNVISENVLSSETDYKPALLRLRSKGVDGLFLNAQDEAGAQRMLRQAREVGLRVPPYAFYMGASASFIKLAGADAEGLVVVDGPALSDVATPEGKKLYDEFIVKFGPMKAWDYGFATTFEAFRALSQALTAEGDPQKYLAETKFDGLFGPFSFDANGDIVGLSLVLKKVENGEAVVLRR